MPTPSDSKDFLGQLRTVHFTLLGVCLAVLVIVTSPGPTWIAKASEQLNIIATITNKDKWNPQLWAEASAEELAKGHGECTDTPDSHRNILYMTWFHRKFKVVVIHRWDMRYEVSEMKPQSGNTPHLPDRPDGYIRWSVSPSPPDTLSKFKAIWDSSGELWCPTNGDPALGGEKVYLWDPNFHKFALPGGSQPVPLAEKFEPSLSDKLEEKDFVWVKTENLEQGGAPDDAMKNRPSAALIQINDTSGSSDQYSILTSAVPKEFEKGNVTVKSQIIKDFPDLQPTAFKDAFRELDQFAGEQQAFGLTFEYLRKSLDSRGASAKETFEVFGIKFPIEATTRWAVLLIISIQGYLWLHLNEYRRRGFKRADVAWIGIYTSWAAIAVSALTMLIVPVLVIVLLCVRQGGQGLVPLKPVLNIVLSSLACIFSAFLAALTAYTLWLINRGLDKT